MSAATRSMTHDVKLTFTTRENVPPELLTQIIGKTGQTGWLSFLVGERQIDTLDVVSLPEIDSPKGEKSKSQRLRAVLYVLWEQEKAEKLTNLTSEEFYQVKMEQFIDHIKSKLE